jgi:hypothetical protein
MTKKPDSNLVPDAPPDAAADAAAAKAKADADAAAAAEEQAKADKAAKAKADKGPRVVKLRLSINGVGLRELDATLLEELKGGAARLAWVHPLTKKRMSAIYERAKGSDQGWSPKA